MGDGEHRLERRNPGQRTAEQEERLWRAGRHYQMNASHFSRSGVTLGGGRNSRLTQCERGTCLAGSSHQVAAAQGSVAGFASLAPTGTWIKNKTKQNPPKQQKTCPLLAMLRYVFLGLLILQMPVRAGGPQRLLFPEFYVVVFPLRGWRPRLENRTGKS